jgi:hypothetical protein
LFLLRSYLPVAVIAYFVIIHRPEDEIVGLLALVPFALIVVVAFIHVAVVVNTDLFLDLFLILLIGSLHFTICVGLSKIITIKPDSRQYRNSQNRHGQHLYTAAIARGRDGSAYTRDQTQEIEYKRSRYTRRDSQEYRASSYAIGHQAKPYKKHKRKAYLKWVGIALAVIFILGAIEGNKNRSASNRASGSSGVYEKIADCIFMLRQTDATVSYASAKSTCTKVHKR